jgi:hypothetical protein
MYVFHGRWVSKLNLYASYNKEARKKYKFHEECLMRPLCLELCMKMKKRLWEDFFQGKPQIDNNTGKPYTGANGICKRKFIGSKARIGTKEEYKEVVKICNVEKRSNKKWEKKLRTRKSST